MVSDPERRGIWRGTSCCLWTVPGTCGRNDRDKFIRIPVVDHFFFFFFLSECFTGFESEQILWNLTLKSTHGSVLKILSFWSVCISYAFAISKPVVLLFQCILRHSNFWLGGDLRVMFLYCPGLPVVYTLCNIHVCVHGVMYSISIFIHLSIRFVKI